MPGLLIDIITSKRVFETYCRKIFFIFALRKKRNDCPASQLFLGFVKPLPFPPNISRFCFPPIWIQCPASNLEPPTLAFNLVCHRHRHHHHHHRFSIHHRSTRLPPLHKNPRWFTLSLSPPINRRRLCHCIGIALTIDGWSITAAIDRGRRSSSETLTIVLSLVDCTVSHHRRPGSSPISNR